MVAARGGGGGSFQNSEKVGLWLFVFQPNSAQTIARSHCVFGFLKNMAQFNVFEINLASLGQRGPKI